MRTFKRLRFILCVALSAAALARAPNYPAAAQELNEAIAAAAADAGGDGIVVVYYDEDDEGVSRGLGRELVLLDGQRMGRFERELRYVIMRARVGTHTVGIDQGSRPVARRVITVTESSRSFLRYMRSVQPTTTDLVFDTQIANLTSLEPIDEDAARERIAAIDAIVTARWRR